MIVTSLISRRRAKVASTLSNQEARVWSTMGPIGTRSVSSAPSVKRLLEPAVSFPRMTSSTAQTAIKICTPNAAPTVGNRCPKGASSTTNKRGTKSVLAVIAATSPWRLARSPFTVVTAIVSSATEDTQPNSASCALNRSSGENTSLQKTRISTRSALTVADVSVLQPTRVLPEKELNFFALAVLTRQRLSSY